MAEKLCTLRTKGGGGGAKYTETSLWTNPSPNSNFAQTTVTLSDSMSNYKYLAFAFKGVTSSTTVVRAVVSVEDLEKMGITSNTPDIRLNGTASANGYSRYVIKASDTTITFGAAYATNIQASDNSRAIPVEILGLNELAHGTVQTARGSLTRGASDITVNLGFEPSFIMLYKCSASATSTAVGDQSFMLDKAWSESSVLNSYKSSTSTGGQAFIKASNTYITTTSTGFTFGGTSSTTYQGTYYYVAIGSTTE